MKSCNDLLELLYDYAAGELTEESRLLVDKHMQGCPSCEAYLDSYRRAVLFARQLPPPAPPPELLNRLLAALEGEPALQDEVGPGLADGTQG